MKPSALIYYGGAFDPPHIGHTSMAEAAVAAIEDSRILVVPTGTPVGKRVTDGRIRLQMARAAFTEIPQSEISEIEVRSSEADPSRISRTIETLSELEAQGRVVTHLLIGGDQLEELGAWHRHQELLERVQLIVAPRSGHSLENLPRDAVTLRRLEDWETSSTQVRRRIAAGEPPERLAAEQIIPARVAETIREEGLYTQAAAA